MPATGYRVRHESDGIAPDLSRAANHACVAPAFACKFGRAPLPPWSPAASINDLIFDRMIDPRWSAHERAMVDKRTAKEGALRQCPGLRAPATLATIDMAGVRSPAALGALLQPFFGRDAIAKPAQASGGTLLLRDGADSAGLARLHALATQDYALVMREMQYAGLPKGVIVEELVPTSDGTLPNDLKFHCIDGEPLLCQVDHARFGAAWSRMLRLPDFEPMDPEDGLVAPPGFRLPDPHRRAAMIAAARALAAPHAFVRVDLYDGRDGVYFGELTFTPAASLGIAPSASGCHRETATHRRYSEILMRAYRSGRRSLRPE